MRNNSQPALLLYRQYIYISFWLCAYLENRHYACNPRIKWVCIFVSFQKTNQYCIKILLFYCRIGDCLVYANNICLLNILCDGSKFYYAIINQTFIFCRNISWLHPVEYVGISDKTIFILKLNVTLHVQYISNFVKSMTFSINGHEVLT